MNKTLVIQIRVSQKEFKQIKQSASKSHLNISNYMRTLGLQDIKLEVKMIVPNKP